MIVNKSKQPKKDGIKQVDKFRSLARELECDDDEEAFKARLRQIARPLKAVLKPELKS